MRANFKAGRCEHCKSPVGAGQGAAFKTDTGWKVACRSTACFRALGLDKAEERVLTAHGHVRMPYDAALLPLLRSMPGARWNPELMAWTVSLEPADRPRVLELAERLKLIVDPALLAVAAEPAVEAAVARAQAVGAYPFQLEGVAFLARKQCALLGDDMGTGKAQPIDTPVLTSMGWRSIGSLKIGDQVIGSNGKSTEVMGVFPQGKLPVFRVNFNDGASTRCCAEHLWSVTTPNDRVRNGKQRIHSLEQLVSVGLHDKGNSKWFIPMVAPIEREAVKLPLEPYLLGALIANGCLAAGAPAHSGTPEQREQLAPILENLGLQFVGSNARDHGWTYNIVAQHKVCRSDLNPLTNTLRKIGLFGKRSWEKQIPGVYLNAPIADRLALLQGLLDNDGCVSKDGMVTEYNTVSSGLAGGVVELVRSLGGIARVSTRIPAYMYLGEKKLGRMDHRIRIKLPGFCPFRVPSKAQRFRAPTKYPPARAFESVVPAGEEECVCIRVAASDQLYVTEDYIVTHNTIQALCALPENGSAIIVCPASLKYNWVDEAKKWRPEFRVRILEGKKALQDDPSVLIPLTRELVIVNYDILPMQLRKPKSDAKKPADPLLVAAHEGAKAALQQLGHCVLIVDEAHRAKNHKAQRTQALATLRSLCGRTWFLTGTPLLNRPIELWGVLSTGGMEREVFGSWTGFTRCFCASKVQVSRTQSAWEFNAPLPEVPERLRRVMLRRTKAQVLPDLPRKRYRDLVVNGLDTSVRKQMDSLWGVWGEEDEEHAGLPSFEVMSTVSKQLAVSRIPAMLEFVADHEEQDIPLVVFSDHRAPIDELEKREGWAAIHGDVAPVDRQAIVRRFQAGELKGLALTIGAGREGLTLTRASNMLFVDRCSVPALNAQATDRCVRIGQTADSVLITNMVSDHPLDRRMLQLLTQKQALIEKAIESTVTATVQTAELREESDEAALARREAFEAAQREVDRKEARDWVAQRLDRECTRAGGSGRPLPALTPERKALIREALAAMLEECDGAKEKDNVGFNKPDAGLMHWIGRTGLVESDDTSFRVAERVLSRYPRQLKGRFDGIWE